MTAETFLDVLIAIMVVGSIFGLSHTRRLIRRFRKHRRHHLAP